jgi:hypothetical protein
MLTYHERKARLPFGAQAAVAEAQDCARTTVTAVLKGVHRNREIEKALVAQMVPRTSVTEAFGPPGPERVRRVRRALA